MPKRRKAGLLSQQGARQVSSSGKVKPRSPSGLEKKRSNTTTSAKQVGAQSSHAGGSSPSPVKLASPVQRQAAAIINRVLRARSSQRNGASVKGLCLAEHVTHKAAVYAVVCETLRHEATLRSILLAAEGASKQAASQGAELVLLYDHLLGQGVRPHGSAERRFLARASSYEAASAQLVADSHVATLADLVPSQHVAQTAAGAQQLRHVRVNILKATVDDVCTQLQQPPSCWPQKHQAALNARKDAHLPDVLAVAQGRDLHDHPLVVSGVLLLQSKASSMPAHALAPDLGWRVVDCCAAPGNKTSQVAAMVGAQGHVTAFERDKARSQLLRETLHKTGMAHVSIQNQDFLAVDPFAIEWSGVQAVLLDPSCSGSGTCTALLNAGGPLNAQAGSRPATQQSAAPVDGKPSAMTHMRGGQVEAAEPAAFPGCTSCDSERVQALARFQAQALRHALRLPALQRLVYSTCSVYRQENEDVVADVLSEAQQLGYELDVALPQWPRRGLCGVYEWSDRVMRVHPELDGTDGFFVALFVRSKR